MAQHRPGAGVDTEKREQIRIPPAKEEPHRHNRQEAFQEIEEKRNDSRFRSHGAEHIGRPGISASVLAYINSMHPAVYITGLNQSKGISDTKARDPNCHLS